MLIFAQPSFRIMNNEHSEEISFFRSTFQDYIAPLMDALKGEYTRLEALPAQCQDEFAIKCLGKNHYKDPTPWRSPKFYGRALLDIFVFIADTKTSPGLPSTKVPTQSLLEKGQTRENNLNRLVNSLGTYVSVAPVVLVLDATFRYAERKKFYDSADLELSGIGIMTPQQIVSFLSELSSSNKKLFTAFIKKWSKRYEITLFREALIAKDLSSATEYLTGTNGGASAFAIEVSSVAKGLYKIDSFTESIQQSIKACKKIDSKYYVKRTDVLPVDILKELEDSYYSEANHEELKVELSAKQHLFSANEYNAIIGSEIHPVIEQSEEQTSLEEIYETPLNNLDACFPGIKQKFKTDEVIDVITDYVAGHYIDDDPDVKKLFKYRITGLGELTPEMSEQKIVWYIKGKHPNDLNGFLFEISSDRRSYQEYVAKFFEFASGKDKDGRPIIMSIPIEPLTQHKNTKIVDALKEYPELRDLF